MICLKERHFDTIKSQKNKKHSDLRKLRVWYNNVLILYRYAKVSCNIIITADF